jgi:hypothetical protein
MREECLGIRMEWASAPIILASAGITLEPLRSLRKNKHRHGIEGDRLFKLVVRVCEGWSGLEMIGTVSRNRKFGTLRLQRVLVFSVRHPQGVCSSPYKFVSKDHFLCLHFEVMKNQGLFSF